jgi:uncharacterized coiled-coil protein SlyX
MWILHFLPDGLILWITNILLGIGILAAAASLVVHRIPVLWRYQLPFKIAALVLLTAGVYLRGGYDTEMAWRERVHELELQVAQYEEMTDDLNKKLAAAEKNKITYIQGRVEIVKQYIDREVKVYDGKFGPGGTCEFPREFINAHNQSAAKPEEKK